MSVRLYNTLTQSVEPFEPLVPGTARMYVCGTTVQNVAHAGHGRTYTTFDVLSRHLRARGFQVMYTRNVTDIDDKILHRAKELGEEPLAFSARMAVMNAEDLAAIGCHPPEAEPKVSETIPEIILLIEKLVADGHAYAADTEVGKDVYFAVRSFSDYGKLSRRKLDDLRVGARVEVGESKRDPLDFALWKASDDKTIGWESPWGKGRPGWHIECSAMAKKHLGAHFDIHCGGMDLIFPHHENEIAQSEAAYGPPFARVWMHGGFLNVDSEKMSKSLGNFVTIRDILARNDAEALRYYYLGSHYRGPMNFDCDKRADGRVVFPSIDEAERRVDYVYGTLEALSSWLSDAGPSHTTAAMPSELKPAADVIYGASERVLDALDRDLNTPVALSVLGELCKAANDLVQIATKSKKKPDVVAAAVGLAETFLRELPKCVGPLGLLQADPATYRARTESRRLQIRNLSREAIEKKVQERTEARKNKDFARGDAIRKELSEIGVELLDGPSGTTFRVVA